MKSICCACKDVGERGGWETGDPEEGKVMALEEVTMEHLIPDMTRL